MTGKAPLTDHPEAGFSLRRWSQRKLAAKRAPAAAAAPVVERSLASPDVAAVEADPAALPAVELPAVESLTFDSDFAGFLRPGVDESLKRAALKQLFRDPRFNEMDGLDTYIDDYTKADPIPPQMLAQLMQGRYVFDPPKTRVTAEGHVVDALPEAVGEATEKSYGDNASGEISTASAMPEAGAQPPIEAKQDGRS